MSGIFEYPEEVVYERVAAHKALEAERDALAARLAAVEALADEWEQRWRDNPAPTNADAGRYGAATRLRAALATGTTTDQQEGQ